MTGTIVPREIVTPSVSVTVPETISVTIAGAGYAAELLQKRLAVCVLKEKGQQTGDVFCLEGHEPDVLAFAKTCKRQGFTVIRNPRGLVA